MHNTIKLNKDLLIIEEKSKTRIVVGLIFLAISIYWIAYRLDDALVFRLFDGFYAGLFALIGLVNLVEGFGISAGKFVGKAFVIVDDERISIKPGIFAREQTIHWPSVQSVDYELNRFRIRKTDNTTEVLDLSPLSYTVKIEVKEAVNHFADTLLIRKDYEDSKHVVDG
jgi:hypothetical protein